jgi:hypothetical protein
MGLSCLRRLNRTIGLLLCFFFISSSGGGWFVIQSFAWANMIWQSAASESIRDSVIRTFDGKHPCEICKHIAREKSKRSDKPALLSLQKVKLRPSPAIELAIRDAGETPRPFVAQKPSIQAARVGPVTPPPES